MFTVVIILFNIVEQTRHRTFFFHYQVKCSLKVTHLPTNKSSDTFPSNMIVAKFILPFT